MFSCEICEIFKNTYFKEDLWTTTSGVNHNLWQILTYFTFHLIFIVDTDVELGFTVTL